MNDRLLGVRVIEENNYYPFGLKHNGYNNISPPNSVYKYKYNGKELQDELGLNVYDFGARNYMPDLGRWANIDPLAEQSRRWTPYNYAYNNPVYFIDPDGMSSESNSGNESSFGSEDFEPLIDMGYGRKLGASQISGAVNYSGTFGAKLSNQGQDKIINIIKQHLKNVEMVKNTDAYSDLDVLKAGALYSNKNVKNVKSEAHFIFTNEEAVNRFRQSSKTVNGLNNAITTLAISTATSGLSVSSSFLKYLLTSSTALGSGMLVDTSLGLDIHVGSRIEINTKMSLNLSTIGENVLTFSSQMRVIGANNNITFDKSFSSRMYLSNNSSVDIQLMEKIITLKPHYKTVYKNPNANSIIRE